MVFANAESVDLTCEQDHGCDPITFEKEGKSITLTQQMIKGVQAMDPRCAVTNTAGLAGFLPFFKPHPCGLTYFFSTAKKSKQKRPLSGTFFIQLVMRFSRSS